MIVMAANSSGVEFGYLAGKYQGALGHLYSPGSQRGPYDFLPYALDNGAYVAWSHGRPWSEFAWMRLLKWAKAAGQAPLWSLVPDVVANREKTIAMWSQYEPVVRAFGFRPAFAVQNGMTFEDAPDGDCILFLGGTTDWKEAAIEPWCRRFPGRVHVGRVNTWPRLIKCYEAGAISVDGTGWFIKKTKGRKDGSGQRGDLIRFCELLLRRAA
jgi:hypothetical protein